MTRWAAFVAGCLCLAGSSASADTKTRVAVVPGVAVNLDAARVDALGQDLADALTTELDIEAIGGLEVRRRLPAELAPDCVAAPACVTDVARRLDVSQVLFCVMVDTGGSGAVQIDCTWVDAASGKSASRPAIDIAVITDAKSRFAAAAKSLLPDAPVRPKLKTGGIDGKMSEEVPRHFTKWSFMTAGVAAIGIGVGIGFGIRTKGLYEDCDISPPPCSGAQEDKIRRSALIADIGYVAGVAAVIGTIILYATSGSESRLVVSPNAEGGGGVTYLGRF